MGTRAKLYFSVLNQCNLKRNCCFLVQKWKMSYEAVFRGSQRDQVIQPGIVVELNVTILRGFL